MPTTNKVRDVRPDRKMEINSGKIANKSRTGPGKIKAKTEWISPTSNRIAWILFGAEKVEMDI